MTLTWNKMRDGSGYWARSSQGDSLTIWGRSADGEGFTLNVNGDVPVHAVKLAEAKAAAETWVEDHLPKVEPVTVGAWSIDDAGNLWKDGEYIGRIVEQHERSNGRSFYAQGIQVDDGLRNGRYISIGSSSVRDITKDEHAALSAKV